MAGFKMKVTPEIENLTDICKEHTSLDLSLYGKYDVKRGLRDINGKGVLAGLTQVSNVKATKIVDGKEVPCAGSLSYRGYDIKELTKGFIEDDRYGFEEVTYLLLFGKLPDKKQLADFTELLADQRSLPTNFVRDVVMKAPSKDIMNALSRSVLTLYSYDTNPDDTSLPNVLRQCLNLISVFPLLSVYGYQAYNHYIKGKSLYIHNPKKELSTAENILRMLRPDKKYSHLEAKILDIALILHMEHGGGNNSTFTTHVVSSSGTDTYSAIAASLGSLKGPRHGGANIKVKQMFDHMKETVSNWNDDEEISNYLHAILDKRIFDKSGLIYGIGHAVYSISDPRAKILEGFAKKLAQEKGLMDEYQLYNNVARLAPEVIASYKPMQKNVSANVDFYSGFIYSSLGLPDGLFTPMFASARISGWCAHRIEEIINAGKIIRPAYMNVAKKTKYVALNDRHTTIV